MLPDWDPERLAQKIPFNAALVGGRRMGKSTAVSDLLRRMRSKFDLVIAFIGSASCNPVLRAQMAQYWDDRFFFSSWDDKLIARLLAQQEALKTAGQTRSVCLLMDDVILDGPAQEQMAHMAMRGRHFNISLAMCSVSYTSLPKRARRSLDCLLVFSLPMQSDLQVLTWEFTQQAKMARFALARLDDYECLVLETLQKRQKLYVWKADFVHLEDLVRTRKSLESQESDLSKRTAASETPLERRTERRPAGSDGSSDRNQSAEGSSGGASGRTGEGHLSSPL